MGLFDRLFGSRSKPSPDAQPVAAGTSLPSDADARPQENEVIDVGQPIEDINWRPGDRVLARWWDLFWYPGSILAIGEKGYHILYDDGDQKLVREHHLMPLQVDEGEHIFIRAKNQPQLIYQPATVVRAREETIDVEYEDGSRESNQRVSRARFWRCPVGIPAIQFHEGDRVLAQDIDGLTYPAEIVTVESDRVIVQFLDGPERMLTPELIRRYSVKVGMPIECRWKAGKQYFPGQISQMEGDRIHVNYDDGDQEWTTIRLIRMSTPN